VKARPRARQEGDLLDSRSGVLDELTPPPSANSGTEALTVELKFADDPANDDY
jgi:hypothetical protein